MTRVLTSLALALASACAVRGSGEIGQGPSGLEGALPGGDGRALRAYRAEYRSDVIRSVDSLTHAFQQSWRRDDAPAVASAYAPDAVLLPGDGSLVVGAEAVGAYTSGLLPGSGDFITWRDDLAASGEMAFTFGRYQASESGGSVGHRGLHFTLASRRGRDWKIRALGLVPLQGRVAPVPDAVLAPDPAPVTADLVRERRGGGVPGRAGWDLTQWAVGAYWTTNSALQSLQHAWSAGDLETVVALTAPDALLRLPGGEAVSGAEEVRGALEGALASGGALRLTLLDHDASERLAYALGRYELEGASRTGFYVAVLRLENQGPSLRALVFTD